MTASEACNGPVPGPALFIAAAATVLAAFVATVEPSRTLMTRGDYVAALRTIESQTRRELAECRTLAGRERELCKAQARAQDRVLKADLDARYQGTVDAEADAQAIRVRAGHALARARCTDLRGEARDSCLKVSYLKL